ncbi:MULTISPECIES: hypothetical protein [unclassified Fusibacter]|uniref:hypothetical protein n=1 Tax=unclassified Fusibacter TaxID=2624464 RepID=UPI001010FD5F|nr:MULTISPECIES: hypothetical protein [unclassified Fusibacter]MCK8059191.1 hypothetical protein [Fusibacter sp. A2]NPE22602.1 hypothetical protein [Fusibacter sp. A1]RXV60702.1 hypothetical protein DWB64_12195 [Fusibacter sp. A1]
MNKGNVLKSTIALLVLSMLILGGIVLNRQGVFLSGMLQDQPDFSGRLEEASDLKADEVLEEVSKRIDLLVYGDELTEPIYYDIRNSLRWIEDLIVLEDISEEIVDEYRRLMVERLPSYLKKEMEIHKGTLGEAFRLNSPRFYLLRMLTENELSSNVMTGMLIDYFVGEFALSRSKADFDRIYSYVEDEFVNFKPMLGSMNVLNKILYEKPSGDYQVVDKRLTTYGDGNAFLLSTDEMRQLDEEYLARYLSEDNRVESAVISEDEVYYLLEANRYFYLDMDWEVAIIFDSLDYSRFVSSQLIEDEDYEMIPLKNAQSYIDAAAEVLSSYQGIIEPLIFCRKYETPNGYHMTRTLAELLEWNISGETDPYGFKIIVVDEIRSDEYGFSLRAFARDASYIVIEDRELSTFQSALHHEMMHVIDDYYSDVLYSASGLLKLKDMEYLRDQYASDEAFERQRAQGNYYSGFTEDFIKLGVITKYSLVANTEDLAELWEFSIMKNDKVKPFYKSEALLHYKISLILNYINSIYELNHFNRKIEFDDLTGFKN